jgi:hypothetical protein
MQDGYLVLAVDTRVLVPAKGRGTAALHSPTSLQLLIAENGLEALEKLAALAAEDVGHFEGRPRLGAHASSSQTIYTGL